MDLLTYEPQIRSSLFFGLFGLFALAEAWRPFKERRGQRWYRWTMAFGIILLGGLVGRLVLQGSLALFAWQAADMRGSMPTLYGILGIVPGSVLEVVLTVLLMDFAIWAQHVLAHKVPMFWRFHRMHHADVDLDVSSGLRFHPVEIGVSLLYKAVWVWFLGPSASGIIIFEALLNGSAMFNHANFALPRRLDAFMRCVIVTPDMHRIHHSVLRHEADSNYGFFLSIWDWSFRTYTAEPSAGRRGIKLGVQQWFNQTRQGLLWLLTVPIKPFGKEPEA